MNEILRVSVFGAGVFGGYHASKVGAHDRAEIACIYDPDTDAAEALAERFGGRSASSAAEAIAECDAVICAVPAVYHKTVCIPALADGRHLLVEKPLADSAEAARAILAAKGADTVLQVGHQERVVAEAIGLHRIPERPQSVEIVRHMGRTERNTDTSIVMDMMIHDLDLLLGLYGSAAWAQAETRRSVYTDHADVVKAEIGFGDFTAYASASRDAEPERHWKLRYASGSVEIDFNAKTLRHDTPFDLDADFGSQSAVKDSLAAAFDRFVSACLDGGAPLATGQDGLAAVLLAEMIEGT